MVSTLDASAGHALVPADVPRSLKRREEDDAKPAPSVAPPPPVPFVVLRGDIVASVSGAVAQLSVEYQVRVLADGWQRIPLITGDLTVAGAEVGRDTSEIEISTELGKRTTAEADEQRALGASLFTVGITGPSYDLELVQRWLDWRDARNG